MYVIEWIQPWPGTPSWILSLCRHSWADCCAGGGTHTTAMSGQSGGGGAGRQRKREYKTLFLLFGIFLVSCLCRTRIKRLYQRHWISKLMRMVQIIQERQNQLVKITIHVSFVTCQLSHVTCYQFQQPKNHN